MHQSPSDTLPEKGSLAYFTGVCFVAALGGLLFGFDTAVISGTEPFLTKQFGLDALMLGWVVSSALFGCVIGSGIGGWLSDQFGRKSILILSAVLFTATGLGCAVAPSANVLTLARFIGGIGVGVASMVAPLYIAEISPPHLRGRMVSFYQFAITIGVLAAYFSNAMFQRLSVAAAATASGNGLYQWMIVDDVWRGMFGSMLVPAGLFLLLLIGVPESPRWLTKRGNEQQAIGILARVAGRKEAEREMDEIRQTIAHEAGNIGQLFKPGMRTALALAVFLACSAQLSGINAIIYYGPKIFKDAGFQISDALGGQVVLGVVNVLFTLLVMWKVDTMGRRPLLFFGNLGVFLSLAMVAVLFATGITGGGLLIFFMCSYLACFAFSLGPLPWVLMSEIFPTRVRGRAMSIATFSLWLTNTIVCLSFPTLTEQIGPAKTFSIFAVLVLPVFLIWKLMPETKGRSLEELEKYFTHAA